MTQRILSIPANMVSVLQGAVILSIISAKMLINDPYAMEKFERRFLHFKGQPVGQRAGDEESGKTRRSDDTPQYCAQHSLYRHSFLGIASFGIAGRNV